MSLDPDLAASDGSPGPGTITAAEQLRSTGHAVVTTDLDGTVLAWNPAAERLYGWSEREAVGQPISDLCVPEMAQETAEQIMEALRAGQPWYGSFPVRRKDGSLFPALVTDCGVYRDGVLVGIVGTSTNVGAALRPLLERSADAALVLREDGLVTYASPAVTLLFGWRVEDVVGRPLTDLVHPDDQPAVAARLRDLPQSPGPRPAQEVRVRRGQGWSESEAAFTSFLDDPMVRGVVCNLHRSLSRSAGTTAAERAGELESALASQLVVERATGFLAGRDGVDLATAAEWLRRHAEQQQLSLPDAAAGVLPG